MAKKKLEKKPLPAPCGACPKMCLFVKGRALPGFPRGKWTVIRFCKDCKCPKKLDNAEGCSGDYYFAPCEEKKHRPVVLTDPPIPPPPPPPRCFGSCQFLRQPDGMGGFVWNKIADCFDLVNCECQAPSLDPAHFFDGFPYFTPCLPKLPIIAGKK